MNLRQMRDHSLRKQALRRPSSLTVLVVSIVVLGFVVLMAGEWRANQLIHSVSVEGLTFVEEQEILELAAVPFDTLQRADLDLLDVKKRVQAHPFVKAASVMHKSAEELLIRIEERMPVAYVLARNNTIRFVDAGGVMLDYRFSRHALDIPLLSGFHESDEPDSLGLAFALAIVKALRESDEVLYRGVSELRLESDGSVTLVSADGAVPMYFGRDEALVEKVNKLCALWNTPQVRVSVPALTYIDLRWRDQVILH